ncbi:MAG: hydrogenase maturation nickel metallochaperone HypA [Alphaproteobacteria bacterium]|nr:hydrogenase maturation nickel metallochaperone HypA [Alphaproteobacteria bacterium]
MHEVSLCESILRIIEKQAEKENFEKVLSLTLSVGHQSGASAESLLFAFPLVAKNTLAENAKLIIKETPGRDLKVSSMEVV